jgi:hypothetical protein
MSKTNESSISISSPVVVSPSTALFPILPFFITFKGDFSCNKQIRKNKKKERRAERRSSIKVIPNVNVNRSKQSLNEK